MRHLENIRQYLETLHRSERIHALVIQSPPGWAKSTTVETTLQDLKISFISVGSYSTPLHLYNTLCDHSDQVIVLDDCAGLFNDTKAKAMSILKAATWPSAGSQGERRIRWGSTSDKVKQDSAAFTGKLILLTNHLSSGKETNAFLSRALSYEIRFTLDQVRQLLMEATQSETHFPDRSLAKLVAKYLADTVERARDPHSINLRTLSLGYELAQIQPESWQSLLSNLLPTTDDPQQVVKRLAQAGADVETQRLEFEKATGLSRRTFFNYRSKLGLGRSTREQR